jgi:phosphatidylcholine synthase
MPYWPKLLSCFAMLLSAAIYYGMEGMVSDDGKHFIGFPVLWNMVVFVFIFVVPDLGTVPLVVLVSLLAVLHFVPILVPYPSRGGRWWAVTLVAVVVFIGSAIACVWFYPDVPGWARGMNLAATAYLTLVTVLDTWQHWARPQVQGEVV